MSVMPPITLGDVSVRPVVEIPRSSFATTSMLPDSTADAVARHHRWLRPHFWDEGTNDLGSRIQSFVVKTPRTTVLIDTCIGNDKNREGSALWHMRRGTFLDDLAVAGVTPDDVDVVVCTHLHVDHVGWNTMKVGDRWLPTFPNARYLIGRTEWDYWGKEPVNPEEPIMDDSVRPILDAGLADLVEADHKLTSEVWLEPTHGHTPGHVSVRISSAGADAVITGDMIHHPCQFARPEWHSNFDWNAEQGRATRREAFARWSKANYLVIGTHFPSPTAGKIVRDGDAYRFAV